jgi:hypothetical protein
MEAIQLVVVGLDFGGLFLENLYVDNFVRWPDSAMRGQASSRNTTRTGGRSAKVRSHSHIENGGDSK